MTHASRAGTSVRTDRSLDLSSSNDSRQVLVIQMHGEPGSGKSTVARELGARINAVVLDKDVIKAALLRTGIPEQQAASGAYEVFFAQARALTAAGHSIILDNPVYWESVERRWLEISDAARSPSILVACVCPDRDELVRRLATRDALESQPREPLNPDRYDGIGETLFEPRLTVDTTQPLDHIVDQAVAYVVIALTTDDRRLATKS